MHNIKSLSFFALCMVLALSVCSKTSNYAAEISDFDAASLPKGVNYLDLMYNPIEIMFLGFLMDLQENQRKMSYGDFLEGKK